MPVKYLRRAYTSFATHVYDIPPRMLAFLILIILSLLPVAGLDTGMLGLLTTANVIAILALSWDLLVGRTGQISMGQAFFFAVGAFCAALLFKYFGLPVWLAIPISLLVGVGIAVVIALPCLRVKGPYLALVTLSLPLAAGGIISYYRDVFGSNTGILMTYFFPFSWGYKGQFLANYYLSLSLMAISAIIIYKVASSRTGVVFVSLLDDELASKACGINVTKYKLMAFAISGLFGSLAGCVYAYLLGRATPDFLGISFSLIPITVTILGGLGTIYGPLVGTYIYYLLNNVLTNNVFPKVAPQLSGYAPLLIFMLLVIIFVLKWPRGIARAVVDKLDDLQEAREIDEIEKKKVKRFGQWRNASALFTRRLRKRKDKGEI